MYYPVNKMGRNASAKSNTINLGFIRNLPQLQLALEQMYWESAFLISGPRGNLITRLLSQSNSNSCR